MNFEVLHFSEPFGWSTTLGVGGVAGALLGRHFRLEVRFLEFSTELAVPVANGRRFGAPAESWSFAAPYPLKPAPSANHPFWCVAPRRSLRGIFFLLRWRGIQRSSYEGLSTTFSVLFHQPTNRSRPPRASSPGVNSGRLIDRINFDLVAFRGARVRPRCLQAMRHQLFPPAFWLKIFFFLSCF